MVRLGDAGKEEEFRASFRATDASHDLAVLQIDAPPELLKPIRVTHFLTQLLQIRLFDYCHLSSATQAQTSVHEIC